MVVSSLVSEDIVSVPPSDVVVSALLTDGVVSVVSSDVVCPARSSGVEIVVSALGFIPVVDFIDAEAVSPREPMMSKKVIMYISLPDW